jgi:5'-methylthioadenosine phosphorylase
MILLLGGTAAYHLDMQAELGRMQRADLQTPYGAACPIFISASAPPLAFASRHGLERLQVSPPFVNARANLWAMQQLGVQTILGWNGVGAINPLLEIHDMLVLDGVLDFTRTRPRSFAEPPPPAPTIPHPHRLTPDPVFAPAARSALYAAAQAHAPRAFACGVYACSEGPRLETAAEIRAFQRIGADVVGMTLVPEVFLARELGIAYGALAYVTNYATGQEPDSSAPRHFGAEVARCCLQVVRAAALRLHEAA